MADQVCQWLFNFDRHTRHFCLGFFEQFFNDFVTANFGVRIHAEDVLGHIHWRRMLVHFSPASSPYEMQDLAVRIVDAFLQFAKLRVDERRNLIGGFQRRTRWQDDVNLHTALIELWQKATAKAHELPGGDRKRNPCQQEQLSWKGHADANQSAANLFEQP